MKVFFIPLFLFISIFTNFNAHAQSEKITFQMISDLLQKNVQGKSSVNIGNWQINYDESYVTLEDILVYAPNPEEKENEKPYFSANIGKAIGDYLYLDHQKDIAYYALRIEDVAIVVDEITEKVDEEEEGKIKLDKIALPIGNVLQEFFAPRIEILMRNITGEQELKVPIVIEDLLIKKMEMLPAKVDTNLYGNVSAKGKVFDGTIKMSGRMNPFYQPMILSMNLAVEDISLVALNPFLKEFGGVDAIRGKVSVFIESAIKGDKVVGYVKFETKDAEMTKGWTQDDSFMKNLKENLADMGLRLLNRGDESIVAGKVNFEGRLDNVEWSFWQVFNSVLRHAIVEPLQGNLEHTINLETVEERVETEEDQ